jgi:hypothetical protein
MNDSFVEKLTVASAAPSPESSGTVLSSSTIIAIVFGSLIGTLVLAVVFVFFCGRLSRKNQPNLDDSPEDDAAQEMPQTQEGIRSWPSLKSTASSSDDNTLRNMDMAQSANLMVYSAPPSPSSPVASPDQNAQGKSKQQSKWPFHLARKSPNRPPAMESSSSGLDGRDLFRSDCC